MLKQLIKIGAINIVILFLLIEALGHALKYKHIKQKKVFASTEYTEKYLKYVNHHRRYGSVHNFSDYSLIPQNSNSKSISAYSCYGDKCAGNERDYDFLIQGDSWAYQFDQSMKSFLKDDYSQKNVIAGGTGSFSPSNMEGQLGFLRDAGYNFNKVIVIIDQTDIGDEFFRYKVKINPSEDSTISSTVSPFDEGEHRNYYNHSVEDQLLKSNGTYYLFYRLRERLNLIPRSGPTYLDINSPLRLKSPSAEKHFKERLKSYIDFILTSDTVQNLYIITHDHYQHLNGEYLVSVQKLVADVLKNDLRSEKIMHIHINPLKEGFCETKYCSDFFMSGDIASHPRIDKWHKIINTIKKRINIEQEKI